MQFDDFVLFAVKIFDILYLNGQSLAKYSVKYRKQHLIAVVKEVKGRMEYVATYEGKSANDVRRRLEEVMDNCGEGLVLKHPKAQYVPNGRNNDWVKINPEYMVSFQSFKRTRLEIYRSWSRIIWVRLLMYLSLVRVSSIVLSIGMCSIY